MIGSGDRAMTGDTSAKAGPDAGDNRGSPFFWDVIWQWMVRHPIASALLILAVQTIPTIWSRDLKPVDELRHAAVLVELLDHGNWLALHMNGEFYPDKPPVYFWLLAAFTWLLGFSGPPIFFLVTAFSAGLLLIATYQMARLVGRGSSEFGLIACLIVLTNVFFIERTHYPRMDMLFSTFISLSLTAFFVGFGRRKSSPWTLAGFGLATLAALTKGPFGLLIPLLTSAAYLAFTRNLRRLIAWDVALGIVLCATVLLLYFLGLYWFGGEAYFQQMFGYVDEKAGWSFGLDFRLLDYANLLWSRWLPWTLLLFFVPWRRLLRGVTAGVFQKPQSAGWAYLGLAVLCTLVPLSLISYVNPNFLIIILPPLAVLSAAVVVQLSARSLRLLVIVLACIMLIVGIVLPIITATNKGLFLVTYGYVPGAVAVATAILLLATSRRGMAPFLLILTAGTTLIVLIHFNVTQTDHNRFKSTRPPAAVLAEYVEKGYTPFSFGYVGYGAFFQFYSRQRSPDYEDWDKLGRELQRHDRAVIITSRRAWELWSNRPPQARVVHRSPINTSLYDGYDWMNNEPYVIAVENK